MKNLFLVFLLSFSFNAFAEIDGIAPQPEVHKTVGPEFIKELVRQDAEAVAYISLGKAPRKDWSLLRTKRFLHLVTPTHQATISPPSIYMWSTQYGEAYPLGKDENDWESLQQGITDIVELSMPLTNTVVYKGEKYTFSETLIFEFETGDSLPRPGHIRANWPVLDAVEYWQYNLSDFRYRSEAATLRMVGYLNPELVLQALEDLFPVEAAVKDWQRQGAKIDIQSLALTLEYLGYELKTEPLLYWKAPLVKPSLDKLSKALGYAVEQASGPTTANRPVSARRLKDLVDQHCKNLLQPEPKRSLWTALKQALHW